MDFPRIFSGHGIIASALLILLLSSVSFSETICTRTDCEIQITLKIAFQGATQQYMNDAESEIEDVWNGPDGYRTTGDCKCKMTFNVITNSTADCKNNPPAGWHCIMVTDYNNNPPRNQTNWTGAQFYIGYMYGVSSGNGGNSERGWWSDIMSRPVDPNDPNGEHYKDFAHEAGHMMGLEDGDGGIMSQTSGPNSNPTQDNIDEIAKDICGDNACPDRCCCGNGDIDQGKGESCDPMAMPDGCPSGQACCPVCCNCYGPLCIPANGEYASEQACRAACGSGATCYKNYKTGCWDCLKQNTVTSGTCLDPANIRGNVNCDHTGRHTSDSGLLFLDTLQYAPMIGAAFVNDRINIDMGDGATAHVVMENGRVVESEEGLLDDPSMSVYTDSATADYVVTGQMSPQQAISSGRVRIEGEGLVNMMRIGFLHLGFDLVNLVNPEPEFVPPEDDYGFPPEYQMEMLEIIEAEPAPDDEGIYNPENVPDHGYIGSNVFPE